MNLNSRELQVAIYRLLTCAPMIPCGREEDCLMVAMALRRLLPDPIPDEPVDPDVVADYAPDWSAS